MGTASNFAVLGASTVTNTGPTVLVSGDLAVSPGSAVTGFPPGLVGSGAIHSADSVAAQAQVDASSAYTTLAGQACDTTFGVPTDLVGLTLVPGVYCFASSGALSGQLTLDAGGDPNTIWVFKIGSTLITGSSATVLLVNGASSSNVFWQVGSSSTLGTSTAFVGTIIALTSITMTTSATLVGRALALNGAVTLDDNTITLPPTLAATTTTLSALTGSTFGQVVTFTATVAPTASGTMTFMDGSTPLGTGTLSGGVASFTTTTLAVGGHSITAVYNGDSTNSGSTSAARTQTVATATTTTTLAALTGSTLGQAVTFTATVAPSTATGTVTFMDGSTPLGTGTPSSGVASFTTTTLAGGSHSITAVYSGNASYATSASTPRIQTVATATTTTTMAPLTSSIFGQPANFTATVAPTASGTMTFMDGSTPLGTGTLSSGVASISTTTLAAGSHSITAVYSGNASYATSASTPRIQTVATATTTTTMAPLTSSIFGQPANFSATVVPGTATGTVTFMDGSASLGIASLSGGVASFTTTTLAAGSHSITAVYEGDISNTTSTSAALAQAVATATTTTTLAALADVSVGGAVTLSATVAPSTATGIVTFMNGTSALGTGVLSSGVASFTTTTLTVGSYSITAVYAGDANDATSTSSALTQQIVALAALPTATTISTPQPSSGGGGGSKAPKPQPAPVPDQLGGEGAGGGGGGGPLFSAPPASAPAPSLPVSSAPPAGGPPPIVVGSQPNGSTSAAPGDGVIRFPAPDAQDHTGAAELRLDPGLPAALPSTIQLQVIADSQPTPPEAANPANLSGGVAHPLAPPIDIQLIAIDRGTGQPVPLPGSVVSLTIEVRLPPPSGTPGPGEEAAWLMEVDDADGTFLGYSRPPSTIDPTTGQMVLMIPVSQLRGTLFLPVLLRTTYVRNFDPAAHIWSSPFTDGLDFGVAAPQWTRMQVLAPPISQRLPVLNAFTGQPGWVDAGGVGLVALDDGQPAVPAAAALAPGEAAAELAPPADPQPPVADAPPADPQPPVADAPTVDPQPPVADAPTADVAPAEPSAEVASDPRPTMTTYAVQSGDTLKAIAAQSGASVQALIAANPRIDADELTIGQQLQLPQP
jgi:hypothetical protein